jgi:cytochrome P450
VSRGFSSSQARQIDNQHISSSEGAIDKVAMIIHQNPHPVTTNMDISSEAFWLKPFEERDLTFEWLRRNAPVSWHLPLEDSELPQEVHKQTGFWAVVRAEDITYVSQNHELFSSEIGATSLRPASPNFYREPTFLNMDPPRHTAYRKVLSAAFTPKAVAKLSEKIQQRAEQIVDRVVGAGDIDFVAEVSSKLPMLTVADLVGVPENLVEAFAKAGDDIVSARSLGEIPAGMKFEDFARDRMMFLYGIGAELAALRRKSPADDIVTSLVEADFDGHKLTDGDIGSMMLLLSVAGNDTTKQTTSRTVIQLDRNPDQRDWLAEDFDARIVNSIEEFVRHASPVMQFARTAMVDTEIAGTPITAGDKVGMFYASGNYDESVFPDPHRFDLSRPRTPHVGFGGGGVHYCLGNGVAKAQLRALFGQILTKLPRIEIGEPEYLHSEFINGVVRLPARIS